MMLGQTDYLLKDCDHHYTITKVVGQLCPLIQMANSFLCSFGIASYKCHML